MGNKTKEIYMYVLATIVVISIMLFSAALIFYPLPKDNIQMVNIALGAFIGAFITVVGYFFGSSKSSSDKNELLTKSGNQNVTT